MGEGARQREARGALEEARARERAGSAARALESRREAGGADERGPEPRSSRARVASASKLGGGPPRALRFPGASRAPGSRRAGRPGTNLRALRDALIHRRRDLRAGGAGEGSGLGRGGEHDARTTTRARGCLLPFRASTCIRRSGGGGGARPPTRRAHLDRLLIFHQRGDGGNRHGRDARGDPEGAPSFSARAWEWRTRGEPRFESRRDSAPLARGMRLPARRWQPGAIGRSQTVCPVRRAVVFTRGDIARLGASLLLAARPLLRAVTRVRAPGRRTRRARPARARHARRFRSGRTTRSRSPDPRVRIRGVGPPRGHRRASPRERLPSRCRTLGSITRTPSWTVRCALGLTARLARASPREPPPLGSRPTSRPPPRPRPNRHFDPVLLSHFVRSPLFAPPHPLFVSAGGTAPARRDHLRGGGAGDMREGEGDPGEGGERGPRRRPGHGGAQARPANKTKRAPIPLPRFPIDGVAPIARSRFARSIERRVPPRARACPAAGPSPSPTTAGPRAFRWTRLSAPAPPLSTPRPIGGVPSSRPRDVRARRFSARSELPMKIPRRARIPRVSARPRSTTPRLAHETDPFSPLSIFFFRLGTSTASSRTWWR